MTEKRFYNDGKYVMQDGEVYVICNGEHNADVVATALNELLGENKQLKIQLQNTSAQRDEFYHGARENANRVGELEKENKQLKQAYQTLKHRHSLLHDECLEAECDRDSLKKDVIPLEKENENLNNVLEDFMVMLNRLQAEPNNKSLQIMAKDMLRMMGKNIMGDVE